MTGPYGVAAAKNVDFDSLKWPQTDLVKIAWKHGCKPDHRGPCILRPPMGLRKCGLIFKAKTNYRNGYNSIKVNGAKLFHQLPEDIKKHKRKKHLVKIYLLSKY